MAPHRGSEWGNFRPLPNSAILPSGNTRLGTRDAWRLQKQTASRLHSSPQTRSSSACVHFADAVGAAAAHTHSVLQPQQPLTHRGCKGEPKDGVVRRDACVLRQQSAAAAAHVWQADQHLRGHPNLPAVCDDAHSGMLTDHQKAHGKAARLPTSAALHSAGPSRVLRHRISQHHTDGAESCGRGAQGRWLRYAVHTGQRPRHNRHLRKHAESHVRRPRICCHPMHGVRRQLGVANLDLAAHVVLPKLRGDRGRGEVARAGVWQAVRRVLPVGATLAHLTRRIFNIYESFEWYILHTDIHRLHVATPLKRVVQY